MFHIVERCRVEIDAFIIYCWAVCVCTNRYWVSEGYYNAQVIVYVRYTSFGGRRERRQLLLLLQSYGRVCAAVDVILKDRSRTRLTKWFCKSSSRLFLSLSLGG